MFKQNRELEHNETAELEPGFKMTELGPLPEDWVPMHLGDLGKISGGGTPSTKVSVYWGGDTAWLVPSDITKNRTIFI